MNLSALTTPTKHLQHRAGWIHQEKITTQEKFIKFQKSTTDDALSQKCSRCEAELFSEEIPSILTLRKSKIPKILLFSPLRSALRPWEDKCWYYQHLEIRRDIKSRYNRLHFSNISKTLKRKLT